MRWTSPFRNALLAFALAILVAPEEAGAIEIFTGTGPTMQAHMDDGLLTQVQRRGRGGMRRGGGGGYRGGGAYRGGGGRFAGGGGRFGYGGGRYGYGGRFGYEVGGAIIGSQYPYYDSGYGYGAGYGGYPQVEGGDYSAYCANRFRSYDPASGTYLGFDGLRHPCP